MSIAGLINKIKGGSDNPLIEAIRRGVRGFEQTTGIDVRRPIYGERGAFGLPGRAGDIQRGVEEFFKPETEQEKILQTALDVSPLGIAGRVEQKVATKLSKTAKTFVKDLAQEARKFRTAEEFVKGQIKETDGIKHLDPKEYDSITTFIRDIERLNYGNEQPLKEIKLAQKLWGNKPENVVREVKIKDIIQIEEELVKKPVSTRNIDDPILIEYIDNKPHLVDGRHRLDQAKFNKQETIPARVTGKSRINELTDLFNKVKGTDDLSPSISKAKASGQSLVEEVRNKSNTVLKLMGNELEDINIIGSTAGGKLKPNDLDILITPKKKLGELKSNKIYDRIALQKTFADELQPLFPDKKIHIIVGDYDTTKGAKMSLEQFAGKSDLATSIKSAKQSGKSFDEWVRGQGEPVFHGTNYANARQIQQSGLNPEVATSLKNNQKNIFLTGDEQYAKSYATQKGGDNSFVLSIRKPIDAVIEQSTFKKGMKNPDLISKQVIPPEDIIIKGKDGKWYPIKEFNFFTGEADTFIGKNPVNLKTRSQLKAEWDKVKGKN